MSRTLSSQTPDHIGETVTINGWVHAKRDHGKVLFIDLRDRAGLLQVVTGPWNPEIYTALKAASPEDVLEISGEIAKRPDKLINPDIVSGVVELQAQSAVILNPSQVPPFEVNQDTAGIDEELRLKYRYLDLRSERMHQNITRRATVIRFIRSFMDEHGFIEVETPLLTASSPEGARDYLVPSRVDKGRFYALPQSPQQYKQLLMVAGIERYYQIVKCLRDEDSRGDRQPEFTQLDMELSFTTQEEILQLNEKLFTQLVTELYPHKHVSQIPWPRLTYAESIEKYGTDKPDLRVDKTNPDELAFAWITDFPLFEWNETEGRIEPMHHMFTMPRPEDLPLLDSDPTKVIGQLYDMVCNGFETASGSIRIVDQAIQSKVFSIIGLEETEARRKFGHMLEAFSYGAPPHGGIAPGIDRLMMILQNEPNIREVIAFPKTGEGRDPMMQAPALVEQKQLDELGLQIKR
jgi:aspartyl-tRNA synthetase